MSFIAVILLSGDTLAVGHKCLFLRGRAALPSSWPRLRSEGGAGPNGVRHGAASREFLEQQAARDEARASSSADPSATRPGAAVAACKTVRRPAETACWALGRSTDGPLA